MSCLQAIDATNIQLFTTTIAGSKALVGIGDVTIANTTTQRGVAVFLTPSSFTDVTIVLVNGNQTLLQDIINTLTIV